MLTEERLSELESASTRGAGITSDVLLELIAEIREQQEKNKAGEKLQGAYVDEIHRLNDLVGELIEYVESVAEIAQDGPEPNDVSTDIKRRAVNMIITSVRGLRKP